MRLGNGIFKNLSEWSYRASDAVSYSTLKAFKASSPWFFYKNHMAKGCPPPKETPSLVFGRAFHSAVLEPELFAKQYVKAPNIRRGTNAWKEFEAEHEKKTILKPDEFKQIRTMSKNIEANKTLSGLLDGACNEVSAIWKDPKYEEFFRSRADSVTDKHRILIDFKTTREININGIAREIHKYKYHWQNYLYCKLFEALTGEPYTMVFPFISTEFPHSVTLHALSDKDLSLAEEQVEEAIDEYMTCKKNDHWPDYEEKIHITRLPNYKRSTPWAS